MALEIPDYGSMVGDPFAAAVQGFKLGEAIKESQFQGQMKQMALDKQKMLNQAMASLWQKPNPQAQDFLQIASFLPEKEAEGMRKNWESLSAERQQNELKFAGQVMSAFSANQPDIAINLLKQRAQAEEAAGRKPESQMWNTQAEIAKVNPSVGLKSIGTMLAALPGSEKTLTQALALMKSPGEVRKTEAEALTQEITALGLPKKQAAELGLSEAQTKNFYSQIQERAAKGRLDLDKLQTETELKLLELSQNRTKLGPESLKTVNDLVVNATAADQSANQMFSLAGRLESSGPSGYGKFTVFGDWLRNATGNQDAFQEMRNEYARLKNQSALKMLPPGNASDKDIVMAQKGMPPENADPAIMSSFLRGMAKLQQIENITKNAQADWINANGSLVRTRQDTQIGDSVVPKNTSFQTYLQSILPSQLEQKTVQSGAKTVVDTRAPSYLKYWQK